MRNNLEKLGIWVANPLEVGPLVCRWYQRGNIHNFYSPTERIGLKTVSYLISGETHLVVHPRSWKQERNGQGEKGHAQQMPGVLSLFVQPITYNVSHSRIRPISYPGWVSLAATTYFFTSVSSIYRSPIFLMFMGFPSLSWHAHLSTPFPYLEFLLFVISPVQQCRV